MTPILASSDFHTVVWGVAVILAGLFFTRRPRPRRRGPH